MMLFQYINSNIDKVKFDVKIGLMPCSTMKHYQIYSRYDYYRKIGNSVCHSVIFTAADFNTAERSVYYIIKKMQSEI